MHDHLAAAEQRRRDREVYRQHVHGIAQRAPRPLGALIAIVRMERPEGDAERDHHVCPPGRHQPQVDQVLERKAAVVGRPEDDTHECADDRERDAHEHAHRDALLVHELAPDYVDHELTRLDGHQDGRGCESECEEVDYCADGEGGHADDPRAARAGLLLHVRPAHHARGLKVLTDVDQHRAQRTQEDADAK